MKPVNPGAQIKLTYVPTDADGNPAKLRRSSVAWAVTDAYTLQYGDGKRATATAIAVGTNQSATVSGESRDGTPLSASADLPDVVDPDVDPESGDAVSLTLEVKP